MTCTRCGFNQTRLDGLGRPIPWCHSCIVQSIDDYVALGPHLPDDEQALIARYNQAMAELAEAMQA